MNCPIIRRQLLALESIDRPSAPIASHLAECPGCRVWQRRLLAVERQLPLLPVPPSKTRERFVQQLWASATSRDLAPPTPPITTRPPAWHTSPRERARQKVALATALAATMIVLTLGFWAWSPPKANVVETAPTYLAQLEHDRNQIVQSTRTPHEKLEKTASLADSLWRNARKLADSSKRDDLAALVEVYGRLVTQDMPIYARALAPADRQATLQKFRDQLTRADSELSGLIAEGQLQPETANQLHAIARAARQGHAALGEILHAV